MSDNYSEVFEQLRREHDQNTQEVYRRGSNPVYHYNNSYVQEDATNTTSWTFSIGFKAVLFIACVLTFSCYIYGGQDVRKGASMAYEEMKIGIVRLEEREPKVKMAMQYIRDVYDGAKKIAIEGVQTNE